MSHLRTGNNKIKNGAMLVRLLIYTGLISTNSTTDCRRGSKCLILGNKFSYSMIEAIPGDTALNTDPYNHHYTHHENYIYIYKTKDVELI